MTSLEFGPIEHPYTVMQGMMRQIYGTVGFVRRGGGGEQVYGHYTGKRVSLHHLLKTGGFCCSRFATHTPLLIASVTSG